MSSSNYIQPPPGSRAQALVGNLNLKIPHIQRKTTETRNQEAGGGEGFTSFLEQTELMFTLDKFSNRNMSRI